MIHHREAIGLDIGGHSVSHPRLTALPQAEQRTEVDQCRNVCRQVTGSGPCAFAFPNGDLDETTVEIVKQCGFELACTSQQELVWSSTDSFRLPRIPVGDYPGGGASAFTSTRMAMGNNGNRTGCGQPRLRRRGHRPLRCVPTRSRLGRVESIPPATRTGLGPRAHVHGFEAVQIADHRPGSNAQAAPLA